MQSKKVIVHFTQAEASILLYAIGTVEDDLADNGISGGEADAYRSGLARLKAAWLRVPERLNLYTERYADEINEDLLQESDERAAFNDLLDQQRNEY